MSGEEGGPARPRLGARLNVRFAVALAALLLIILGASLALVGSRQQADLMDEQREHLRVLGQGLVPSLKTLMVTGDGTLARAWLERVADSEQLIRIQVLRKDGSEAFRDLATVQRVNEYLGGERFQREALPAKQAQGIPEAAWKRALDGEAATVQKSRAGELTRLVPIRSAPACQGCHGYDDSDLRGVLRLTTSTQEVSAQIRRGWWQLVLIGVGVTLLLGLSVYGLVQRQVIAPIKQLMGFTQQLGEGRFSERTAMDRADELGLLAGALNRLAANLEATTVSRGFLERLLHSSPDGLMVLDGAGRIRLANQAAARLLGLEHAELEGRHAQSVLGTEALQGLKGGDWRQGGEVTLITRSGERLPANLTTAPLEDLGDGDTGTIIALQDLTQRKELEEALRASHEEFRNVVTQAHTGIVIVDAEGRVLFSNAAARHLLDRDQETLHGSFLGIPLVDGEVTEVDIRRANHEVGVAELGVTETVWEQQHAYLAIFYDITERKQAEEAVYDMAYHDQLTGLANRRALKERLDAAIPRAQRTGTGVGVLLLDLDRFKEVNDSLGHEVGDGLLRAVGEHLPEMVRAGDTVARLSGDEFGVLVEGLQSPEDLYYVAEKVRRSLSEEFDVAGRDVTPKCSIGYSLYPDNGEDAESLLRQADTAMYVAKEAGGNTIQGYHPEFGQRALRLLELDQSLNQAYLNGEFELFYQPQVELSDEHLLGMEALLRWRSPERGLVSPGEFIPRLEETGLIVDVGDWLMSTAWQDLARLRREGGGDRLSMSINLSARQLEDAGLVDRLRETLSQSAIDPACLTVEITETELVQQVEDARSVLSRINEAGVQVALDDFGTGYSSLTYLRRFPVQEVKIDKSFVQELPDKQDDAELVKAIIAMAHSFGKRVLAEGVETREQADFLRAQGCDRAQGFFFGKPVPVDQALTERGFRDEG